MRRNLYQTPDGDCVDEPFQASPAGKTLPASNPRHKVNNQKNEDAYLEGLKRPGGLHEDGCRTKGQQHEQAHAKYDRRDTVGLDDLWVMRPRIRADRLDWQCDDCMSNPGSPCKCGMVAPENDAAFCTHFQVAETHLMDFDVDAIQRISCDGSKGKTPRTGGLTINQVAELGLLSSSRSDCDSARVTCDSNMEPKNGVRRDRLPFERLALRIRGPGLPRTLRSNSATNNALFRCDVRHRTSRAEMMYYAERIERFTALSGADREAPRRDLPRCSRANTWHRRSVDGGLGCAFS